MNTLKSTFLPNLGMDAGVTAPSAAVHFCPMCGQAFERPQQAAEHMQLCHGVIASVGVGAGSGGGILMAAAAPQHHHPPNAGGDSLKIDYPCLNCEDKFPTAQELDEHHRLIHQAAAFLARCLTCGIYGISSQALQEGDEYKCMHCGSICTAAAIAAGQPTYLEQQQEAAPQTPEEMPAMAPDEREQQLQQQQHHHQHQQQSLQQQQQQQQEVRDEVQLKVPPLTVKLNKNANGGIEGHPHVIIKQEPLSTSESGGTGNGSGEITPTSLPVYTIQQPVGAATSVVVSTAAVARSLDASNNSAAIVGNKVRHKCPDCPKTFKTPGTLAMHRKVHTGEADATPKERPYTCSYCGKSFTQSNTLKQHTRIHTGEKPFHCGYCEKSFSVKDYLTKHIRTHTGEKPYTCPYCDKRFTQRSALTVHTTKLHPL